MFRRIDDTISVSAQITPDDVAQAARAGFTLIVNNRPDEEEGGQPLGAEIAAAAAEAGLAYRAIPVSHAGFSGNQIDEMEAALAAADGPMLAFCRSGTRSTFLWALTRARQGDAPDVLAAKAAGAGYDIASIRPMLDALGGSR